MPLPPRLLLDLVLAALLMLTATLAGCGDAEPRQAAPAGGEAAGAPVAGDELDGEGMEPRIVTEHPVDAPGRPADDGRGAVAVEAEPAAAWVPHLTARDLDESVEFYRGLGFEVGSRRGEERVELERDGVRLVLVAAPGGGESDGAAAADAAGEDAAPAAGPGTVLHLVGEAGGEGGRTVRDPDGHRVVVPGGG